MADNGWVTLPFDQAVLVNPPVRLERGEVYPFVDMQAVDPGSRSVGPSELREFKGGGSRFMNGDTLMARITPCLENGKIARYAASKAEEVGHGSTEFIVIRGRPNVTDNGFAYYLTKWDGVRQYCISQMTGSSGRQRVPTSALSHREVTIPPLKEQEAIACILGALDDKIELNRQLNRTLEDIARAIFKSWFVDFDPVRAKAAVRREHPKWTDDQVSRAACPKLKPEIARLFPDSFEDSELGEIPKGWSVGRVCEIAGVIYGAPFSSAQFNSVGIGEPLIRIRDLANEAPSVWTAEMHPKGYKVRPGDIVVGMDGEFRAYLWGGPEGWLNQRICVFVPKPGWSAAYVRNAIMEPLAHVEATETATTVIHLGKADIDRFRLVIPPRGVAELFNRMCQPWYDAIVRAKQESRTLAALRDALLPKLIRGEIRVKDAERFLKERGL